MTTTLPPHDDFPGLLPPIPAHTYGWREIMSLQWLRVVATTARMTVEGKEEPDDGIDAKIYPGGNEVPLFRINVQMKACGANLPRSDGSIAYNLKTDNRYERLLPDADGNSGLLIVIQTPSHPLGWVTDESCGALKLPVRSWWLDVGNVPGNVGTGFMQHNPPGKIVLPAENGFNAQVLIRKAYAINNGLGPIT